MSNIVSYSSEPGKLIYVIRPPKACLDEQSILETINGSLVRTKYKWLCKDQDAPEITNCITAIRYLFSKHTKLEIPSVYIGDMPRTLVTICNWSIQQVLISEIKFGDLLFLRSTEDQNTLSKDRYIVHVLMSIGQSVVFHSSVASGTGSIEDLSNPSDTNAINIIDRVVNDPARLMCYIDPRNQKLRKLNGSEYLPIRLVMNHEKKALYQRIFKCGN